MFRDFNCMQIDCGRFLTSSTNAATGNMCFCSVYCECTAGIEHACSMFITRNSVNVGNNRPPFTTTDIRQLHNLYFGR